MDRIQIENLVFYAKGINFEDRFYNLTTLAEYLPLFSEKNIDEWENLFCEDEESNMKEFEEYYSIDDLLYKHLKEQGEAVIEFAGYWIWGREDSGTSFLYDTSILRIIEKIKKFNEEEC